MSDVAWQTECSVEADASPAFAWSYMTDVRNWDDPPARFALENDGPFAAGAQGTTLMPGQEPRHWTIREVAPGRSYVLEMPLDRATLSFEWRFEAAPEGRVRITQRLMLRGENATAVAAGVEAGFGPTLPEGMKRIAGLIERAAATCEGQGTPGSG